jgi:CheY-like chemotaxis protein
MSSASHSASSSEGRLLVVDDCALVQKMLVKGLEKIGFEVEVAANGIEGLDKMMKEPFRAVLMDFMMPVMDGITATILLRRWERCRSLLSGSEFLHDGGTAGAATKNLLAHQYIIGISATTQIADLDAAQEAGMNQFATKPLHMDNLVAHIARDTAMPAVISAPPPNEDAAMKGAMEPATSVDAMEVQMEVASGSVADEDGGSDVDMLVTAASALRLSDGTLWVERSSTETTRGLRAES